MIRNFWAHTEGRRGASDSRPVSIGSDSRTQLLRELAATTMPRRPTYLSLARIVRAYIRQCCFRLLRNDAHGSSPALLSGSRRPQRNQIYGASRSELNRHLRLGKPAHCSLCYARVKWCPLSCLGFPFPILWASMNMSCVVVSAVLAAKRNHGRFVIQPTVFNISLVATFWFIEPLEDSA